MTLKTKPVRRTDFDPRPEKQGPCRTRILRMGRADVAITPVMAKLRPHLHHQIQKAIEALPGYGGVSSHDSAWIRCHVSWNFLDADIYVEPNVHAFQCEEPEVRAVEGDNNLLFGRYVISEGVHIYSHISLCATNKKPADVLPWLEDVRTVANIMRWAEYSAAEFLERARAEIGAKYLRP